MIDRPYERVARACELFPSACDHLWRMVKMRFGTDELGTDEIGTDEIGTEEVV